MENILYQCDGKPTYEGTRIYIDKKALEKSGFLPGKRYRTVGNEQKHQVVFLLDDNGKNKVSKKIRNKKEIPVIDKTGNGIRTILEGCEQIKITFYEERVLIEGIKSTASTKKEQINSSSHLRSITFCAGAGISSHCNTQSGFEEVAAVEWNPKEGAEDKFSDIYLENHPQTVMFNLPMQQLRASDLPDADLWCATLDCTDFSKASNGTKKKVEEDFHTLHLFTHLLRLFWELPKERRPLALLIENVEEFEKVAGNTIALCLKEEGFYVTKGKLNSLDYGSRTQRERFFLVATIFPGFELPKPTGRVNTPILFDGTLSLDQLKWTTPEENGTLRYFLTRQTKKMTHNHKMTTFDVTKDTHVGTITKSHHKIQPENWIVHPNKPNTYAYLTGEQVKALQGIPKNYYLGDSNKMIVESVGQSVCVHTFSAITQELHDFLQKQISSSFCQYA